MSVSVKYAQIIYHIHILIITPADPIFSLCCLIVGYFICEQPKIELVKIWVWLRR